MEDPIKNSKETFLKVKKNDLGDLISSLEMFAKSSSTEVSIQSINVEETTENCLTSCLGCRDERKGRL